MEPPICALVLLYWIRFAERRSVMRRATTFLVVLAAVALLAGRGAAPPLVAHAAPAIGVGSVSGPFAFSLSTHDPITGQEGAAVGTMVFNGAGGVSGVYSQNERCPGTAGCGDQLVMHATYAGTYIVRSDASTTLDICINNPSSTVRVIFEGAFSDSVRHLRLVLTEVTAPCVGGTLGQVPNITSGTADRL
jgi:hypothetical protein